MSNWFDETWPDEETFAEPVQRTLTVAGLLKCIKGEFSRAWSNLTVEGEIHSIKAYPSGHVYFDLKDAKEDALLSCVIFRRDAMRLRFSPKVGDVVEVKGGLNVYEPRGQMNFIAREMSPAGAGALYAQFLALKEKLAQEGLFDAERKKEIPTYPVTIGVVTSPEAAALRDVLRTLKNNAPWVNVILYPTSVQGAQAQEEILAALDAADQRQEVDVVLVVRGGGSLADLWSFNLEAVARRIAAMTIPVISGVGHETDFTIADFVSDLRAATPTAAAAVATQGWVTVVERLTELTHRADRVIARTLEVAKNRLSQTNRMDFAVVSMLRHARLRLDAVADIGKIVQGRIDASQQRVDMDQMRLQDLTRRLLRDRVNRLALLQSKVQRPDFDKEKLTVNTLESTLKRLLSGDLALCREKLKGLKKRLSAVDVNRVMQRGFSLVVNDRGEVVRDVKQVSAGQTIEVRIAKGRAKSRVESTSES